MIDKESYKAGCRDTMIKVAEAISGIQKKVLVNNSLYVNGYLMAIKDISTALLNMNTERQPE